MFSLLTWLVILASTRTSDSFKGVRRWGRRELKAIIFLCERWFRMSPVCGPFGNIPEWKVRIKKRLEQHQTLKGSQRIHQIHKISWTSSPGIQNKADYQNVLVGNPLLALRITLRIKYLVTCLAISWLTDESCAWEGECARCWLSKW